MDKIQQNVSLAEFTTFNIGGAARYFIEVREKQDLKDALEWAEHHQEKVVFLGGGSNILVNDQGVEGLVIRFSNDNVVAQEGRLKGGSGASLARSIRIASGEGLSGLEWAGGIPGATLGGAIRGNAGAFGADMSTLVETVEVFDVQSTHSDPFRVLSNRDCVFGYRSSIFKAEGRYIIWGVVLKMTKSTPEQVKEDTQKIMEKRRRGQPNLPNAGCIFKNVDYGHVKEKNPELLQYAESTGVINNGIIPAGWIIDSLELRGKAIGGAKISLEHANFIVNTGKATCMDVISLITHIKKRAKEELNIEMEEEIQYFGF